MLMCGSQSSFWKSGLLRTLIGSCCLLLCLPACQEAVIVNEAVNQYQQKKEQQEKREKQARLENARNSSYTHHNEGSNTTSEFTLKDGKMEGLARQNYPDGSLWKESNYENGQLQGTAKVYFRNGQLKREVDYENGKKHGRYVKYFKSGKPKAEMEYDYDLPLPGIVERGYRGEVLEQPDIVVTEEDLLSREGNYNFHIKLSSRKAEKIYVLQNREEWRGSNPKLDLYKLQLSKDGVAILPLELEKGYRFNASFYIYATYPSQHGLDAVAELEYDADVIHQ